MRHEPACPVCQGTTRLFEEGTIAAHQFFLTADSYTIASGERRQRLPLYVCSGCGHGFSPLDIDPKVVQDWYEKAEEDNTFLAGEFARRLTARAVLRRIALWQRVPGTLLDAGAGPGIFVSEAVRAGWQAYGLEPAAWAVSHGREEYQVPMVKGNFKEPLSLPMKQFDVVTLFDVIEHVPEPLALLQSAAAVLRPGGLLVLITPRFDSVLAQVLGRHWYCIFPAHLQYFTSKSLRLILTAAGFDLVKRVSHTRYVNFRYGWRRLHAWLTDAALPVLSRGECALSVPINFGDEFEVYALKR